MVEVRDTGVGIEKKNISKLFQPFSSSSPEHHKEFGGTGLGLWMSKVIVELMGGTIQCLSEVNQGSTFRVSMPIEYPSKRPLTRVSNRLTGGNLDMF